MIDHKTRPAIKFISQNPTTCLLKCSRLFFSIMRSQKINTTKNTFNSALIASVNCRGKQNMLTKKTKQKQKQNTKPNNIKTRITFVIIKK